VIRSGSTGRALQIPGDVTFQALLPLTCNERPARSTISFFATGMSCGGTIVLSRLGTGFEVRGNWLTGGIGVAARTAPTTLETVGNNRIKCVAFPASSGASESHPTLEGFQNATSWF